MSASRPSRLQMQGTAVAIEGAGVLLRGPSGAGKSSLALRLIAQGAVLVADDLCEVRHEGGRLTVDLPGTVDPRFRGCIERRGQGILKLAWFGPAPLALVVDLKRPGPGDELPSGSIDLLGLSRPLAVLDPFQEGAATKLRQMALRQLVE